MKLVTLVPKPRTDNYADCDGDYLFMDDEEPFKDEPVFVNVVKQRIMAKSGGAWMITAYQYLAEFRENQPDSFGGFHGSNAELDLHHTQFEKYNIKLTTF